MQVIASAKGGKVLYEIVRYPQRNNREVIVEYCFLKQRTKDMAEVTEYGKDFSSLGESTWIYDIMICSIDPY